MVRAYQFVAVLLQAHSLYIAFIAKLPSICCLLRSTMATTIRAEDLQALTVFFQSNTSAIANVELQGAFNNSATLNGRRCSFALARNKHIKVLSVKVLCDDLDDAIIAILLEAIAHSILETFTLDAEIDDSCNRTPVGCNSLVEWPSPMLSQHAQASPQSILK